MDSVDGVPIADLTASGPEVVTLRPEDLGEVGEELAASQAHFAPLFARREQREWAEVYLRGLLIADVRRKNVEAMALRLLGAGADAARQVRALQQCNNSSARAPGRTTRSWRNISAWSLKRWASQMGC
jgi:hypothetical protein